MTLLKRKYFNTIKQLILSLISLLLKASEIGIQDFRFYKLNIFNNP